MLLRKDAEIRHQLYARPRFSDSDSGLICDLSATGRTIIAHQTSGAARVKGIRRDGLEVTCRSLSPALPVEDEIVAAIIKYVSQQPRLSRLKAQL